VGVRRLNVREVVEGWARKTAMALSVAVLVGIVLVDLMPLLGAVPAAALAPLAAKTRNPASRSTSTRLCSQPRCWRCRPRPWPSASNSATNGALDAAELGTLYTAIDSCKRIS